MWKFVWLLMAVTSLGAAVAGSGAAQSVSKSAAPRPSKPAAAKPAAKARADADIEGDIRRRFARSKIHADQFTVKVLNGVAVIEGTTKVIQRKGVATRLARLGGARSVDNRIQIDEAARAAAAAKLQKSRADRDSHGAPRRRVQVSRADSPN